MRILVAEDNAVNAEILRVLLSRLGHDHVICADAFDAMAEFAMRPFDCIISDYFMPGMDGLGLCKMIRERCEAMELPYVYFLLITALDAADIRRELLESTVDDFVTRPISPIQLEMRLRMAERIARNS